MVSTDAPFEKWFHIIIKGHCNTMDFAANFQAPHAYVKLSDFSQKKTSNASLDYLWSSNFGFLLSHSTMALAFSSNTLQCLNFKFSLRIFRFAKIPKFSIKQQIIWHETGSFDKIWSLNVLHFIVHWTIVEQLLSLRGSFKVYNRAKQDKHRIKIVGREEKAEQENNGSVASYYSRTFNEPLRGTSCNIIWITGSSTGIGCCLTTIFDQNGWHLQKRETSDSMQLDGYGSCNPKLTRKEFLKGSVWKHNLIRIGRDYTYWEEIW